MLPDCLPWLGVLGEWTNPLWLGVCKRLSKHLQWTQCHIERLCIRDYCRTQHFDRPDLWNMSGKIAGRRGIPKPISRQARRYRLRSYLRAPSLNVSLESSKPASDAHC